MADFNPHDLIAQAKTRQLRHGEVLALETYLVALERELSAAQTVREARASDQAVTVALTPEGVFAITFPGLKSHTVRCTSQFLAEFLFKTLRDRQGKPSYIATGGAPTQADLEALAKASKKKPKALSQAPSTITLEDLGL